MGEYTRTVPASELREGDIIALYKRESRVSGFETTGAGYVCLRLQRRDPPGDDLLMTWPSDARLERVEPGQAKTADRWAGLPRASAGERFFKDVIKPEIIRTDGHPLHAVGAGTFIGSPTKTETGSTLSMGMLFYDSFDVQIPMKQPDYRTLETAQQAAADYERKTGHVAPPLREVYTLNGVEVPIGSMWKWARIGTETIHTVVAIEDGGRTIRTRLPNGVETAWGMPGFLRDMVRADESWPTTEAETRASGPRVTGISACPAPVTLGSVAHLKLQPDVAGVELVSPGCLRVVLKWNATEAEEQAIRAWIENHLLLGEEVHMQREDRVDGTTEVLARKPYEIHFDALVVAHNSRWTRADGTSWKVIDQDGGAITAVCGSSFETFSANVFAKEFRSDNPDIEATVEREPDPLQAYVKEQMADVPAGWNAEAWGVRVLGMLEWTEDARPSEHLRLMTEYVTRVRQGAPSEMVGGLSTTPAIPRWWKGEAPPRPERMGLKRGRVTR